MRGNDAGICEFAAKIQGQVTNRIHAAAAIGIATLEICIASSENATRCVVHIRKLEIYLTGKRLQGAFGIFNTPSLKRQVLPRCNDAGMVIQLRTCLDIDALGGGNASLGIRQ